MNFLKRALLLLITYNLLLTLLSCAHIPKPILPAHVKRLTIPIFHNKTLQYGLEEKLTNYVIEEFILDGELDIVPKSDADAELIGEIIFFNEEGISYNEQGEIIEYEIWIEVKISFYDLIEGRVFWEDKISNVTTYNPMERTFEDEVNDLLMEIAKDIVSRSIKRW